MRIPLGFAAADSNVTVVTVNANALRVAIVNHAAAPVAPIVIAAAQAATAKLAIVSTAIKTTASAWHASARPVVAIAALKKP